MSSDTFTTTAEADDLVAVIAAALPTWHSYFTFDGLPHARPLSVDTFTVPADDVPAALAALRTLPDTLAEAAGGLSADWRDADLTGALRAWGWAAEGIGLGAVRVGGIWGDVVFPACFPALLAIAPYHAGNVDPWIFAADRDDEPVLAVSFTGRGLTVHRDVDVAYCVY